MLVTAVFVHSAGFEIYKAGGYMEDVGDAVEIIADIDEGKTNVVIIDMTAMAAKKSSRKS